MTAAIETFLTSISKGIQGLSIDKDPALPNDEWEVLLQLAYAHSILPLVCDKVYNLKSFKKLDESIREKYQEKAVSQTIRQIEQEKDFLTFILFAQQYGYDPAVIKGLTVRNLYPQSYLRLSVDEDILVPPEDAGAYDQILLDYGFDADEPEVDVSIADELSYHKPNSPSYIELHKYPFERDSDILGDFNHFFDGIFDRTIHVQIEDVSVRTLAPTDHLLYLILHAFKHFVHSGIGIRAVCDIGLFAERYAAEIEAAEFAVSAAAFASEVAPASHAASVEYIADSFATASAYESGWEHIRRCLEKVHALDFARALFRIVKLYLLPDAEFYKYLSIGANCEGDTSDFTNTQSVSENNQSEGENNHFVDYSNGRTDWNIEAIDIVPLLDDILAGGVHGNSSLERLRSSNITLKAIANDKKKTSKKNNSRGSSFIASAFHSVFLPLNSMSARFPYLKKAPALLPFAWVQRISRYVKERISTRFRNRRKLKAYKSDIDSAIVDGKNIKDAIISDKAGADTRNSVQSANESTNAPAKSSISGGASESIRLGRSRVELLRKYGIIR